MSSSGGSTYAGPSAQSVIVSPLVFATVYQNLLPTALFLMMYGTNVVTAIGDEAIVRFKMGPTAGITLQTAAAGVMAETATLSGTFDWSLFQVIPSQWYYSLLQTTAGGGSNTSAAAVGLT